MAVYKNISCKPIIRKIMRDLKPNNAEWVIDAVEWIGEALEHIGSSSQLVNKQTVCVIANYRCVLPTDLYYINQVAVNESTSPGTSDELTTILALVNSLKADIAEYNAAVEALTSSELVTADLEAFDTQYKSNVLELRLLTNRIVVLEGMYFGNSAALQPLKYGSGTFHRSMHAEGCSNEFANSVASYIIDDGYIKTSFPSGQVCLSYMAFPIDAENYPMVPDDISFKEAMFWYIFKKLLLGGFDKPTNKIDYAFADQKWRFYCTQARNAANYPDIAKYESFMNQWARLIPNIDSSTSFFEDLNDRG
tara:strand:+ start:2158 stop:3078 length:921 start_codon:yes stop_codon:yes gene_type:complete